MNRLVRRFELLATRAWQLVGIALALWVLWIAFNRLFFVWVALFVAFLVAALLTQPADWLEDRGVPRTPAALIVMIGGLLAVGGVISALAWRFVEQLPQLAEQLDEITRQLRTWVQGLPISGGQGRPGNLLDQAFGQLQGNWESYAGQALRGTFTVVQAIGGLLFALVLAFFLLRDRRQILDWAMNRSVSEGEHRDQARSAVKRAWETLQAYIRATVIIGLLDALLIGAGLLVLGVPLAVPLMALTFFGAFFPVVGATVAGAVAAGIAAITGGLLQGVIVVGIVLVVQQIDGNILQPMVMGHEVNLHPIAVMLALTAGGLVAGIVGAAMAVPVTAVIANVTDELRPAET